jgi:hypothetical protein
MTDLTIPEPQVRPTTYSVSCIPEDDINARHFTLKVEYRGNGLWAVTDGGSFLGRNGTWSDGYSWRDGNEEPATEEDFREESEGQEAWRAVYRHDLDTALRLAKEAAPHMLVNGHTVADALARRAERESR